MKVDTTISVMQDAFFKAATDQCQRTRGGMPAPKVGLAGAEQELFLFKHNPDGTNRLITDAEKNAVLAELAGESFGIELGAACIEIHPAPVDLRKVGFVGWQDQLQAYEYRLVEVAAKHGFSVGREGTVRWASLDNVERTDTKKYIEVPDFHNRNRKRMGIDYIGDVCVRDAAIVGLLNSFQFSLQCNGYLDAVDKLNYLFMISPIATALSANATHFGRVNTGWADVRFEVWRKSHDTRTEEETQAGVALRVGLPNDYFRNINEYFREVQSYPFILNDEEHALQIGIGLFWRDARIKFINDEAVVEFRPISTQASVDLEIEIAAFTIGRLIFAQSKRETLIPMDIVRFNKEQAEHWGLRGSYVGADGERIPMARAGLAEISKAMQGLQISGIPDASTFRFARLRAICQDQLGE